MYTKTRQQVSTCTTKHRRKTMETVGYIPDEVKKDGKKPDEVKKDDATPKKDGDEAGKK